MINIHKRNFSQSSTPTPSSHFKKGANNIITNSSLEISREISNKLNSSKQNIEITNRTGQKTKTNILRKDYNSSPGVSKSYIIIYSMDYGVYHYKIRKT